MIISLTRVYLFALFAAMNAIETGANLRSDIGCVLPCKRARLLQKSHLNADLCSSSVYLRNWTTDLYFSDFPRGMNNIRVYLTIALLRSHLHSRVCLHLDQGRRAFLDPSK